MKIQPCLSENNMWSLNDSQHPHTSPSFQASSGSGAFGFVGGVMQWIQNKGFLASFLIQDGLGMTLPRVGTAYMRDREVTGEFNFQEGKEVLLRESITGPVMMVMAPLMLLFASFFGKSTTINSQLIKRFGNSFREMIVKPDFKKELFGNRELLRKNYIEHNVESILNNTIGKGKYSKADINYIMEHLNNYANPPAKPDVKGLFKKKAYKSQCLGEIENRINELKYSSSTDLDLLNKLKVGTGDSIRVYDTKDAIEALMKYSDDIIMNNKHLSEMTPEVAENFKYSSIAKRIITTVATVAATLGALSVIPKIYAKSDIAPGARTAMLMKEANKNNTNQVIAQTDDENTENPSFKGKGEQSAKGIRGLLAKLGKFIEKHQNENISSEFEYNGHNFTNTLMALLSVGGLLFPRGLRAYKRAQVDENGKKDKTELYEILIRDLTSSLAVIFAVPMLTRAFVTSYENKTGFVLMHKNRNQSKWQNFIDLINPYSKAHVLTNKEIESLYHNVDSLDKIVNFCKYIDKNNGDLQKIFAKSEFASEIFNEKTIPLASLNKLSKEEKNRKITEMFEKLGKETGNKESINKSIKKMMQGGELKAKSNKLLSYAKGLNSMPAAIATFLISPILLGWFIPTITYRNTRRIHAKQERENKNKVNTAV